MKNLLIILAIFANSCCYMQTSNTSEDKHKPFDSTCLIGEQFASIADMENNLNLKLYFEMLDSISYQIEDKTLIIVLERIRDWTDPGDFHRIKISYNDKDISFFNPDGWVGFHKDIYHVPNFIKDNLIDNNYVALQKASPNDVLLFAFGYIYASSPSLLSIINLTYFDTPQLVFNADNMLYNLKDINNDNVKDIEVSKFFIDDNNTNVEKYLLLNGNFIKDTMY